MPRAGNVTCDPPDAPVGIDWISFLGMNSFESEVLGIGILRVLGCAHHARHQAVAQAVRLDIPS